MAQQIPENGVTLPSVKTYYTERSDTHLNEKEKAFLRREERSADLGLPDRVSTAGGQALP